MFNVETVVTPAEKQEVENFLMGFGLRYELVDNTVVVRDKGKIIGSCSHSGNVLKCFGVDEAYQGLGITNLLLTSITDLLHNFGIYHNFIFTKPSNVDIFASLGYKCICKTDAVALLETGNFSIDKCMAKMVRTFGLDTSKGHAAIVMNCNPFTLGHKHLIEQASLENESVLVFIVEEDKSVFKFRDRIELVRRGVAEFENVQVIAGSRYIISSATFPSYFLKQADDVLQVYTELDCRIFGQYFASVLNINRRYVGSEPSCDLTSVYNETLLRILPEYGVEVRVVERVEIDDTPISASLVRKFLEEAQLEELKQLVPSATFQFLTEML